MRFLLTALLLAVFFEVTCAQAILTNDIKVSEDKNPAQLLQQIARNVAFLAKTMGSVLTKEKALRIDFATTMLADDSLPVLPASGQCSRPFVEHESMCLAAVCNAARWLVARQTCATLGGDLIWLESSKEHSKANNFFANWCGSSESYYWTSLRWNENRNTATRDLKEAGYANAPIIDAHKPRFASNVLTRELRGHSLRSKLAFVCRQAPKIGRDTFQAVQLKDLDIAALGINRGPLDIESCRALCAKRGAGCVAFHRSSVGICFEIEEKKTELWNVTAGVPLSSYYVRSRNISSRCSSAKFPFAHSASRYRFERGRKTWGRARANCEALGGRLVELTTDKERDLINADRRTLTRFPLGPRCAHIGMKQKPGSREPRGGWEWYPSGLPVQRNLGSWNNAQPDNFRGREHLGCLRVEGGLNDIDARAPLSSICECSVIE